MFSESFVEAWERRYGHRPPFPPPPIDRFLAHRSVRRYREEDVPEDLVRGLIGAAQSAATSSNLQLWTVISVQESERREAIARLCADQDHVRQAPWFFAFLADHFRLQQAAAEVGEAAAGLDYVEYLVMALVDAALAAERMVCAAESLGLSICYIGALRNDPEGVRRLLDLPERTFGIFGLCLGWPAEGVRAEIKPRLSPEAVWHRETYRRDVPIAEYDERMRAFYEGERMKGEVTWSMRSGRRVDEHHLTGREVLLDWLRAQRFCRR